MFNRFRCQHCDRSITGKGLCDKCSEKTSLMILDDPYDETQDSEEVRAKVLKWYEKTKTILKNEGGTDEH